MSKDSGMWGRIAGASLMRLSELEGNGSALERLVQLFVKRGWAKYAFTLITELAIMMGNLVAIRLAAQMFGPVGFGEYTVAKRAVNILTFPLLMGMGISIPKFLAETAVCDPHDGKASAYLLAWVVLAVPSVVLFVAVVAFLRAPLAFALFGGPGFQRFALPIVLATVGLYLQNSVYAYYRGLLQMRSANILRFVGSGVVPVVVLVILRLEPADSVLLLGALWTLTALVAAVIVAVGKWPFKVSVREAMQCVRNLVVYGLPRVPGELALFGFFAVPTFFASHRLGLEEAGFVSFALSLVQYLGALFATASIILLPYVSRLVGSRAWSQIRRDVTSVLLFSVLLAGVLAFALILTAPLVVDLLLGHGFSDAAPVVRLLAVSVVPYVCYIVLRSPLDSLDVWPHNSINLSISLAVMVAFLAFGKTVTEEVVAVGVALTLLAVLSLRSWRRVLLSV